MLNVVMLICIICINIYDMHKSNVIAPSAIMPNVLYHHSECNMLTAIILSAVRLNDVILCVLHDSAVMLRAVIIILH